ncbi:MAG: hypothetical protein ACLP5H_05020 [Desulfomonilaceae bacterium]
MKSKPIPSRLSHVIAMTLGTLLLVVAHVHAQTNPLPPCNEVPAKQAIIKFVKDTADKWGLNYVRTQDRQPFKRVLPDDKKAMAEFAMKDLGKILAANQSSDGNITNVSSADPERAQNPREFIESRLGGKIVKLEKDPSDMLRAVLLVERNGSVIQHVLEATLNTERELEEVRIITTNRNSAGIPPVIVIPLSVASKCWLHCKEKCGQGTDCRMGCLFDCMVAR